MDRDPRTDTSPFASPTGWLISLLLVAGFVAYFIVPKLEASWKARGVRLPTWAIMLIETSHFVIKYGYVILILIGLASWIWLRRPASGPPRE
jgi:type II secretory pathway component PulF